jgi:hypothetical protein
VKDDRHTGRFLRGFTLGFFTAWVSFHLLHRLADWWTTPTHDGVTFDPMPGWFLHGWLLCLFVFAAQMLYDEFKPEEGP